MSSGPRGRPSCRRRGLCAERAAATPDLRTASPGASHFHRSRAWTPRSRSVEGELLYRVDGLAASRLAERRTRRSVLDTALLIASLLLALTDRPHSTLSSLALALAAAALTGAAAQDPAGGWLGYATDRCPSGRLTFMDAYWKVGATPRKSGSFYSPWFGSDTSDNLNLIQPVNPCVGAPPRRDTVRLVTIYMSLRGHTRWAHPGWSREGRTGAHLHEPEGRHPPPRSPPPPRSSTLPLLRPHSPTDGSGRRGKSTTSTFRCGS